MNENVKNNIFYRPNLEIEHNYQTDGSISRQPTNISEPSRKPTILEDALERAQETQEELLRIYRIINTIPEKTAKIIKDIVEKQIFQNVKDIKQIENIINEDNEKDRTETYLSSSDIYEPKETEDPDSDIIDPDFWTDPPPINVDINVVKCKTNTELAYEQYLKDGILIREDFAFKLKIVMQDYVYPLYSVMGEVGLNSADYLNLEYEGETVSGVADDDKHLHDIIVRNQILIDEKNRKFSKTHGANNTLAVMTAFDIVSQQRVQYYKESYDIGISSFNEMFKRNYLEEVRKEYESKYFKAKINMYRYLDSATIVLNDILKKTLESQNAKCYLLTKDVNIYARKTYSETVYDNSTDNNMKNLDGLNTTTSTTNNTIDTNQVNTKNNTTSNINKNTISNKIDSTISNLTKSLL